ncbi:MAG: malonyl-ACP O-methyltransferase BioC [Steroidobacteraceae bacterium]|jgi:malonyl-CoA O-methyltransferase
MAEEDAASAVDAPFARRAFGRASASYDAAAVLQGEVRNLLLERLELTELEPRIVLDAGAGTGLGGQALKRRYPRSQVLAVDSAHGMLRAAAARSSWLRPLARVCADVGSLPLKDASVDLIFSNFMLPWGDPDRVFAEFRRVLAPRGLLTFTTLGPDTLRELRSAWASADSSPRVHPFMDMHDLGDALVRSGFAEPVLDVERYTLEYADVSHLAADLKAVGEVNALAGRRKGLTGPRIFEAMRAAYEAHRRNGRLPATYEVVFGQAWGPRESPDRLASSNTVSLEDMRRQLAGKRGRR